MMQTTSRPPGAGEALIDMRAVDKIFHTPAGEFVALKGIDTGFHEGEFVGVVGQSGSGKSTLVNMLTGIDRPSAGEVIVGGVNIHRLSESAMARWRGRHMGIVFQFYQLLPTLTILENVLLPMDFSGAIAPDERLERAMRLLEMVGMGEHAGDMPMSVSGGQQQSAAIARALANDPPIVLADEPTGNLDSRAAEMVFEIFEDLAQQGKTIIMVTHDDALAARANRVVRLADGQIISDTYQHPRKRSHVQTQVA
jgi:ABC-type lipoprotein export system ATPase subunit